MTDFSVADFRRTVALIQKRIPYKIYMKPITRSKLKKHVEVFLRSEIKNMNEAMAFIKAYERVTHLNFNFSGEDGSNSHVCSRKWICTHGIVSGLNRKCPASISILIRKVGKRKDLQGDFFKENKSLPAEIRMNLKHNHNLVFPLSTDKYLRIDKDVKLCFFEYFKRGYFGRRAKLFHEQYLQRAKYFVHDETMNPSLQGIYTLANNWLKRTRSMETDKASISENSGSQILNIKQESEIGQSALQNEEKNYINNVVTKLKKEPTDEFTTENIPNEIVDVQPALSIKQEITDEDENAGLPIILSYGSLAVSSPPTVPLEPVVKTSVVEKITKTSTQNATTIVNMVQPSPSQVVVYDQSSNIYKVVKYLSVNTDGYSTNRYKSYLPNDFVTTRMSLQRL